VLDTSCASHSHQLVPHAAQALFALAMTAAVCSLDSVCPPTKRITSGRLFMAFSPSRCFSSNGSSRSRSVCSVTGCEGSST
jgi:hypothetical protein